MNPQSYPQLIKQDFQFDYDEHYRWVLLGWQIGRLEFIFKNQNFDPQTNLALKKSETEIIESIKPILTSKGITLHDELPDFESMSKKLNSDIQLLPARYFTFYLIGIAALRISMSDKRSELIPLAKSCIDAVPSKYLQSKDLFFNELVNRKYSNVDSLTDYLTSISESSKSSEAQPENQNKLAGRFPHGVTINTGGGDFIYAGDKVGGDKAGRDIIGGDLVYGNKTEETNITLEEAFSKIQKSLDQIPESPEKEIAKTAVQQLEVEGKKGDKADEKKIEKWFNTLIDCLPDIGEIAVNTLINPISGLSTAISKVASMIKKRNS